MDKNEMSPQLAGQYDDMPKAALALIDEARMLFPIPPEAAAHYQDKISALTNEVDETLLALPTLSDFIARNRIKTMLDIHRHHAQFMANVLELNLPNMLIRGMLWAYRSYAAHGFSNNYFVVAINAWQKAVRQYLKPAEALPIDRVYGWLIARHAAMVELSRQEPTPSPVVPWTDGCQALLDALIQGDTLECLARMDRAAKSTETLTDYYLFTVQPVFYRIGLLWETNEISVAQEHLATAIVAKAMPFSCRYRQPEGRTKGTAVITAAPNELHDLGARIVADLLEHDGWDVTYLGANTPAEDLVDLAEKLQPTILGISAAMPFNLIRVRDAIRACRQRVGLRNTLVLVGGKAFNESPSLWQTLGADGWAPEGREAVRLADRWHREGKRPFTGTA